MAAGLGFKTFTVGEVLSAADVNGYLMQGVLVFATTAARDAAITSPQEGQFAFTKDTNSLFYYDGATWVASGATGDIEGVTAGTGISGGGTSGTVTVTNSMATAIDAKGDLIVGTGADAFSRLAVGTNGQVLTADSSEATGLKFATPAVAASGLTLISTTTIGSGVSSATVSGAFSATYDNYLITLTDGTNSSNTDIKLTLGSTTTGYYNFLIYGNPSSGTVNGSASSNVSGFRDAGAATTLILDAQIRLFAPFLTKRTIFGATSSGAVSTGTQSWISGFVDNSTSYTDFTLAPNAGTMTGGKIRVYGYQNS